MEAARKIDPRYTYADYCGWDDSERWELIDGVAYALASPSRWHQTVSKRFFRQLDSFLDGKHCEAFYAPFSVRLNADADDNTVVEPDILVVCDESKLNDGKGVIGAPDFIVEVLSPSTAAHDLVIKFRLYQRSGVREYWTVDPERKTTAAHVLQNGKYNTRFFNELDSDAPVEVLEGCVINLSKVFEGL